MMNPLEKYFKEYSMYRSKSLRFVQEIIKIISKYRDCLKI